MRSSGSRSGRSEVAALLAQGLEVVQCFALVLVQVTVVGVGILIGFDRFQGILVDGVGATHCAWVKDWKASGIGGETCPGLHSR